MDELQRELESDEPPPDQWNGGPPPRAIRWGHAWEDTALENLALDLGLDLARPPFVESPTVPYIGASSDALVLDGFDFAVNVEVKCPISEPRHTRVVMNRQIPDEHFAQMTCQMFVHDLPFTYFVSFHPYLPDVRSRLAVLKYERDPKLEQEMLNKCADFYEIFKRGDRPKKKQVTGATGFPDMNF